RGCELGRPVLLHAVDVGDEAAVVPGLHLIAARALIDDLRRRRFRDRRAVEVPERAGEAAAVRQVRDQEVDHEPRQAETASADRDAASWQARHRPLAAAVLDLAGDERDVASELHSAASWVRSFTVAPPSLAWLPTVTGTCRMPTGWRRSSVAI